MPVTEQERAVTRGKLLVGAIWAREVKRDEYLWELADLSAANTPTVGGDRRKQNDAGVVLSIQEWAKEIGWLDRGYELSYMKKIITEARAWPKSLRVEKKTLGQHADSRAAHGGDAKKAARWLKTHTDGNVRDSSRTISEITGSGPIYEARLKLYRARRLVISIPATLAKSNILGNEANFPQFRDELVRLRNALDYLDRYVADEMVVDRVALDAALNRILAGEEAA